MIRNNWGYKLLAIAVALGLWVYVNSERNPQSKRTIVVPVVIENADKNYIAATNGISQVSVTISGQKLVVDSIEKNDIHAWVDMESISAENINESETKRLPIKTKIDGIPDKDLQITIKPTYLNVSLESVDTKNIPIEVNMQIGTPAGYSYATPKITPSTVKIEGKVSDIKKVKRAVVNLGNIESIQDIDIFRDIELIDEAGNVINNITLQPQRARVQMHFEEVAVAKTLLVSPNITGRPKHPGYVVSVKSNPESVTIEGKLDILKQINTVQTEKISIEGMSSSLVRNLSIELPAGVTIKGNKRVQITVEIAQEVIPEDNEQEPKPRT